MNYPGDAVLFGAMIMIAAIPACSLRSQQSAPISAKLSPSAYAKLPLHGSAFGFPALAIFDGSGALVYNSEEARRNARILRSLPTGIASFRPQAGSPRLTDILDAIPEFKARKQEILLHRRPAVLSVALENCHACAVQEDALRATQGSARGSVDLLAIEVISR